MTRLSLDYQRSMKPFPAAGVGLLLAAVAISAITGEYYYRLIVHLADGETTLRKFEQVSGREGKGGHRGIREISQEVKQANAVLRQLSLPWERLFQTVESSTNQEVVLLGMEPDVEKRTVNISCEAKNIAAMLDFIMRLEERKEFDNIYLQSHQIQENDPEKPVRFSITAMWRAAS